MTHTRKLLWATTILSANVATFAQAQDSTAYSLDPIIVQTADTTLGEADKSTSIYVADAELEAAAMGDAKDLFAGLASVSVGGAIPSTQKIFVNGVDMLNLAVEVDGVSQNNRIFHHVSANAFDPGLMKFVRVDPGVAPADAGPNALAGRVVMETIDAEDFLEDGDNFGGQTRLSYSDNGNQVGASATLVGRKDGFEAVGYLKRVDGEDYDAGDGEVELGTETDMLVGLVKLAYETDRGDRFEFSAQELNDEGDRNYRANFGTYLPRNPFGTKYDTKRKVYSFNYENIQGSGLWNPEASIGYSESEVDVYFGGVDTSFGDTSTYSAKLQNTFYLSPENTITAGIDYQDQESAVTGEFTSNNSVSEKNEIIGIFAQGRFQATDQLHLSAGLRFDHHSFTGQDFSQTGDAYKDKASGLSANLSAVFDVTDNLSVHGGYSKVFGGFGIEDNFLFYEEWDYGDLEARDAENIIVGADITLGDFSFGAELFNTKINNGRGVSGGVVNSYDFESRGFNLDATFGWTSGFARLTYSNSEVLVDGTETSSFYVLDSGAVIGQVLALEVQQELANLNLTFGGSVEVAFDHDFYDGFDDADYSFDGYEVLDLFVEYRPPAIDDFVLRLSVDNVFDREYADRATYGGEYGDYGLETLSEPGRTISLVATKKF